MTEEKEESPYQIYYSIYCDECYDGNCVIKKKEKNDIKSENILWRSDVRNAINECAKLRDLLRNYYRD